jgi:heme A synthase
VKRGSMIVAAALHATLSYVVFFGLMASALRNPDAPATSWKDAGLLAVFWAVFFPSLLLQRLGLDLWALSLLVVIPNTLLWVAVVSLIAWAARKARRPSQRPA